MGLLIDGQWHEDDVRDRPSDARGSFVRPDSVFRNWITPDGSAGPAGKDGFKAEPGRYHIFIASNCPWAHRTAIFRKLKGLDDAVSVQVADAPKSEGWSYTTGFEEMKPRADGIFRLHQVYTIVDPRYTGKVTVPTLWDRKRKTIVNNESSEIIRMLNSAFLGVAGNDLDFYPAALRGEIDEINGFVYEHINNGVYRSGFAKTQEAYDTAVARVFKGLDWMEDRLSGQRYLAGSRITEADWRAFPTLIRFDLVYYSHFKCNIRRVIDYPNLSDYTRELYQWPGIRETCHLPTMKSGYYQSMPYLNPSGIVPAGPDMSWLDEPHGRDRLQAASLKAAE
ncbi:MAG: glutathione S-transferase family protein [Hyphomicrobiaceae bacterium]